MSDAILIYRERITEHLKHSPRESLPTPLRQIDLLLAYRKYEDATKLADGWMELENRIADLLKSNHEEVDEFNAGYEAYKAGLDLEDAERTYGNIQHELGVPSHDTFSTGYAWAKFQAAALREGAG